MTTTYDALGRVSALTDHDGTGVTYIRDAEGRVTKESYSDGSTTEYDYNSAGLLTLQKEVAADNSTRRQTVYAYDDAGNLSSENRSGVGIDKSDELVRYYYDKANQLVRTNIEGVATSYTYDLAGNLLSDGRCTYTYDAQNRLLTKTGADGTTTYDYDAAGNLVKTTAPDGAVSYTYNAQNKLVKGEKDNGESSSYTYNALGVRIENEQVRINQNADYQNSDLKDGSHGVDYMDFLRDGRADWQRAWETEIGTIVQPDMETVTRHYVVDYLSVANRDIYVVEDGSYTTRYVYDAGGARLSAEFDYAPGTQRGEGGENLQTDRAVAIGKVWYRTSLLGSTLFAVDADGEVVAHMIYDPWGNPLVETYPDANFSGLENLNNFTGYTWDETLGLYFAQNRFYDAESHRFTQEDSVKDGANWYVYCGNNPVICIDAFGNKYSLAEGTIAHLTIQAYVAFNYPTSIIDRYIYGVTRTKTGKGRADVVISDGEKYHVYEIKSDQYSFWGAYQASAFNQRDSYIQALNANPDKNRGTFSPQLPAVAGTILPWDSHIILPYLPDPNRVIDVWTVRNNPGMIFYSIKGKKIKQEVENEVFISLPYKSKIEKYYPYLACDYAPSENYLNVDTYYDLELNNEIIAWLNSAKVTTHVDGALEYTKIQYLSGETYYHFERIRIPGVYYPRRSLSRQEKMNIVSQITFEKWTNSPSVDLFDIMNSIPIIPGAGSLPIIA